mmetsp:Transcript_44408/g.172580  ORF Transcript_44408/g.172580 Transcript_44408/m.172580 type:complete len:360 (-) Transcript_44408:242-1321(-)
MTQIQSRIKPPWVQSSFQGVVRKRSYLRSRVNVDLVVCGSLAAILFLMVVELLRLQGNTTRLSLQLKDMGMVESIVADSLSELQKQSREIQDELTGHGQSIQELKSRTSRQDKKRNRKRSGGPWYNSVFEKVYVVTFDECIQQEQRALDFSSDVGLDVDPFRAFPADDVKLGEPNLGMGIDLQADCISRHEVAAHLTHRQIWHEMLEDNYTKALIISDDLIVKESTLEILSEVMGDVEEQASTRDEDWHMVTFRRRKLDQNIHEEVFAGGPDGRFVTKASPSLGVSFYALSNKGAALLLSLVDSYRQPLDMQLAMLQESGKLKVLSACDNNRSVPDCPENAQFRRMKSQYGQDCRGQPS